MMQLLSKESTATLLSFPTSKKAAFLVLLYEKTISDLESFCINENRDFSVFEKARKKYWQTLANDPSSISWDQLREDILNAAPDSENFNSQESSFALNAALVAADIAAFLSDEQDSHILESLRYALNSLSACAINKIGATSYNSEIKDVIYTHPLVRRGMRAEEEDVAFLKDIEDPPWSQNILSLLQHRAETQEDLLQ